MKRLRQNYWAYYLALTLFCGVLLFFSLNHPVRKGGLYGVVESPKVRLNHPRKVSLLKVAVSPGQKVEKGDLLMELRSEAVEDELQAITFREKQLESEMQQEVFQLQIEQKEFELKVLQDEQEFTQEKRSVEAALARDKSWLEKFSGKTGSDTLRAEDWRISYFNEIIASRQAEIRLKQDLLLKKKELIESTYQARKNELMVEKQRLTKEAGSLRLVAPAAGTIDNVYFMEGQTADSFSDLLTLLPEGNKYIRAYITEQTAYLPEFTQVRVQSVLTPGKETTATFVGSGGVEILPAQIQDSPLQLSGKEVFFKMDHTQGWLQGEKVLIVVP